MAINGFVIGFSESTSTNPTTYWDGDEQVETIDDAEFFATIALARLKAGELQVGFPENHVEAYSATKTIAHNPALGTTGV